MTAILKNNCRAAMNLPQGRAQLASGLSTAIDRTHGTPAGLFSSQFHGYSSPASGVADGELSFVPSDAPSAAKFGLSGCPWKSSASIEERNEVAFEYIQRKERERANRLGLFLMVIGCILWVVL